MSTSPVTGPLSPALSPDLKIDNLGLVAGEGDFPILVARAARSRSIPVTAIGLIGITSPELEQNVTRMHWIKFGKFEQALRLLQGDGVTKLIMVGRVKHSHIFKLSSMDMRSLKLISRLANKKADSILGRVVEELASENIEVLDSSMFLRDCMPSAGLLTPGAPPTDELRREIEFGLQHARSIAGLDIGQTVVVKSQSVVAVEAMEGTDATIERAGKIAGSGIVMCKVAKPQQDRRFDIPVLGLTTIRKLVAAGATGLAFPGNEILFFDREEAIALAEENHLCIIAV